MNFFGLTFSFLFLTPVWVFMLVEAGNPLSVLLYFRPVLQPAVNTLKETHSWSESGDVSGEKDSSPEIPLS